MLEIRLRGFVGMFILLLATLAIGWLCGGLETAQRKTLALATSLRNVGVGLVIATGAFANTLAVTATVVYGLIEKAGSLLVAVHWLKHLPETETAK